MTKTDWLERTRRNRRWRWWVHGLQLFGPSIPTGIAITTIGEHGLLPKAVTDPLLLAVFLAGLLGWAIAMVGMLTVVHGDSAMFNAYRTRVFRALAKDLFSLHAPPPLVEKPWPSHMRPPADTPPDSRDALGSGSSDA